MATFEFDVYDLSPCARRVVRAAVNLARLNSSVDKHVVPLERFFHLAGIAPKMPLMQFKSLLNEVKHTGVFSSDYEPAVLRGWSVFEHLASNNTHLEFSVCHHAFEASEPVELLMENDAANLHRSELECCNLLYLDFDGVLHADDVYWSPKRGIYMRTPGRQLFEWMGILQELLEPHPEVRIVLSTSWVRMKSFDYARLQLSLPLQAKVVGSTFHRREIGKRRFDSMSRGAQVIADVQRRQPRQWVAVDNDDWGWPSQWRANLVKTQDDLGLSDPEVQDAIRSHLAAFEVATKTEE